MEFNRKVSPRPSKRLHESPLDRKIRQLSEISDHQSQQVKQLLLHEIHQLPSQILRSKPLETCRNHPPSNANNTSTPRKRYRCEDFMERQLATAAAARVFEKQDAILPLIPGVEITQEKRIDQQMQYFKSPEYQHYLEKLVQGSYAHHNTNTTIHNRKQHTYLHRSPNRSPKVQQLTRPRTPLFTHIAPTTSYRPPINFENQPQTHSRRPLPDAEPSLPRPCRMSPAHQRIKTQNWDGVEHHLEAAQMQTAYQNAALTLQTQPVDRCMDYLLKLSHLPKAGSHFKKHSLHKQIKECTNLHEISPKRQASRKSVSPSAAQVLPARPIQIDTHRLQVEFCNRRLMKTQKTSCKAAKKYKGRIENSNKENYSSKSLSSPSSQKSPYNISFKIDHPAHIKHTEQPYKEAVRPLTTRNAGQFYPKPYQHFKKQPKNKLVSEPSYEGPRRTLEESQTNSTATKTDHSRKPRKISLISRSKLK